eukprot:sb/3473550/
MKRVLSLHTHPLMNEAPGEGLGMSIGAVFSITQTQITLNEYGKVVITKVPTDTSKQPIRTRHLGHVTGYQPIRDQYYLCRLVPVTLCGAKPWVPGGVRYTLAPIRHLYHGKSLLNLYHSLEVILKCIEKSPHWVGPTWLVVGLSLPVLV